MNRFFISKSDIRGDEVVLSGQQAHQIRNVLRMTSGEGIIVLDNTGCEYEVVLTGVDKQKVTGRIESRRAGTAEPQVRLTLYQSLLPRDKFELVLQKCTEVGVAAFIPLITSRSLVHEEKEVRDKMPCWERVIREAAEQSGRGLLLELLLALHFPQAVDAISKKDAPAFILWEK